MYLVHLLQFHGDGMESCHKFIKTLFSQTIVLLLFGITKSSRLVEILRPTQEFFFTLPILLQHAKVWLRVLEFLCMDES